MSLNKKNYSRHAGNSLFTKGAFTLPVYACVYRIALRFLNYLPWFVDIYGKKVITSKTQRNAENACGNRIWQLGLKAHLHTPF